jgi:predicted enzyme related to lactoylglutathione lyase
MSTPEEVFLPGTPCWAELITHDPQPARDFYGAVFGWDQVPPLAADPSAYGVFVLDGQPIAAIGWIPPGTGLSPVWLIHLATRDVDTTCASIGQHGGRVVRAATDRVGLGRSAIVADPAGAVFAVTELRSAVGPSWQNHSGGLIWSDLRSSAAPEARQFYASVFGYNYTTYDDTPGFTAITAPGSDETVGGLGQLDPQETGEFAGWLAYLSLDIDTDTAVAKARSAGATVRLGPYDMLSGRAAMLTDPQGAPFAMIGDPVAAQFA